MSALARRRVPNFLLEETGETIFGFVGSVKAQGAQPLFKENSFWYDGGMGKAQGSNFLLEIEETG